MAKLVIAFVGWVERLLYAPGDDEEARRRKVQFTIASILVAPAGLVWGVLYFAFGERTVAAIPTAYPVLTLVDFLILLRLRRYEVYRQVQLFLILVLPFALQLALGGFVGSSLVILWSFIAVLMALLQGRDHHPDSPPRGLGHCRDRRQRAGHPSGDPAKDLRPVLHDQGPREGDRPGSFDQLRHCCAETPGRAARRIATGLHSLYSQAADRGAIGRGLGRGGHGDDHSITMSRTS
jgi:hypothetical protein